MRLTTKGRFAVTAMIDLASRQAEGPVTLAGIAERQKISLSYLEQLFGKLRRYKLVTSVRGPGGGYRLAWTNLNKRMYAYLDSVTLGALVEREVKPDPDVNVLKDVRRRAAISLREAAAA